MAKIIVTKEEGGTFGLLAKRTRPGEVQNKRLVGLTKNGAKQATASLVERTKTHQQASLPTE